MSQSGACLICTNWVIGKQSSISPFLRVCSGYVCINLPSAPLNRHLRHQWQAEPPGWHLPVQLSPSWWRGQSEAVPLAGESVTWSAIGYLHKANAANGERIMKTITRLASQRTVCTPGSKGKTRRMWQVNCRWVTASVRGELRAEHLQIPGSHPDKHFLLLSNKRQFEQQTQLSFWPHCWPTEATRTRLHDCENCLDDDEYS